MKIQFGDHPSAFASLTPADMIERAKNVEKYGYDACMLSDRSLNGTTKLTGTGFPDCFTVFGALAMVTKKVRFGCQVTTPFHRPPGTLAAQVTAADILSNGRMNIGIGANTEHYIEQFGIKWNYAVTRMAETIDVIKLLWTGKTVSYNGKFYKLKEALQKPNPVQKPHPPIWVAGNQTKSLELAGKVGEVWQSNAGSPAEVYAKHWDIVKAAAEKAGNNPDKMVNVAPVIPYYLGSRDHYLAIKEKALKGDSKNCPPELQPWYTLSQPREPLYGVEAIINHIEKYVKIGANYFQFRFRSAEDMATIKDKVVSKFV